MNKDVCPLNYRGEYEKDHVTEDPYFNVAPHWSTLSGRRVPRAGARANREPQPAAARSMGRPALRHRSRDPRRVQRHAALGAREENGLLPLCA